MTLWKLWCGGFSVSSCLWRGCCKCYPMIMRDALEQHTGRANIFVKNAAYEKTESMTIKLTSNVKLTESESGLNAGGRAVFAGEYTG